jgi:hypothetical protein
MSLRQVAEDHVAFQLAEDGHFAEPIYRHREKSRQRQQVTAIITWLPVSDPDLRRLRLEGSLQIAPSDIDMSDTWEIGGLFYVTAAILPAQYGMQEIRVTRKQVHNRTTAFGVT